MPPPSSEPVTGTPPITPERVAELLRELSLLDVCELVLELSRRTSCQFTWKHPRCSVSIKRAPRAKASKTV